MYVGPKTFNVIACERNIIAFERNVIAWERNSIAFERIVIACERNVIAWERNSIAFERNNMFISCPFAGSEEFCTHQEEILFLGKSIEIHALFASLWTLCKENADISLTHKSYHFSHR